MSRMPTAVTDPAAYIRERICGSAKLRAAGLPLFTLVDFAGH